VESIVHHIKNWFLAKQIYFEAFARNDTRLESWFKGELLVLFEQLRSEGVIENFEREPNIQTNQGRRQVDFAVTIKGETCLCELKAACISQAKGTPRNVKFYFRKDDVGLIKDFRKLNRIADDKKWVLAFFYPKPSMSDWSCIVSSIGDSRWYCVTKIDDYPEYFFIALWQSAS